MNTFHRQEVRHSISSFYYKEGRISNIIVHSISTEESRKMASLIIRQSLNKGIIAAEIGGI
jgi:hypothetical protein